LSSFNVTGSFAKGVQTGEVSGTGKLWGLIWVSSLVNKTKGNKSILRGGTKQTSRDRGGKETVKIKSANASGKRIGRALKGGVSSKFKSLGGSKKSEYGNGIGELEQTGRVQPRGRGGGG